MLSMISGIVLEWVSTVTPGRDIAARLNTGSAKTRLTSW
jgi:hypothetical protein